MSDWNEISSDTPLPDLAVRVLVETEQGSLLFGKRVHAPTPTGGWRWIDDQSCPIQGVLRWKLVVAKGETV